MKLFPSFLFLVAFLLPGCVFTIDQQEYASKISGQIDIGTPFKKMKVLVKYPRTIAVGASNQTSTTMYTDVNGNLQVMPTVSTKINYGETEVAPQWLLERLENINVFKSVVSDTSLGSKPDLILTAQVRQVDVSDTWQYVVNGIFTVPAALSFGLVLPVISGKYQTQVELKLTDIDSVVLQKYTGTGEVTKMGNLFGLIDSSFYYGQAETIAWEKSLAILEEELGHFNKSPEESSYEYNNHTTQESTDLAK